MMKQTNGKPANKEKGSKQILNIYLNLNKFPEIYFLILNPRSDLVTKKFSLLWNIRGDTRTDNARVGVSCRIAEDCKALYPLACSGVI